MARIGVIVLAAGRSTRFTGPESSKLLARVGGVPLVRAAVRAAVDAQLGDVVVVTGARAGDVVETLAGLPITVVHAARFADGMAHSLRRGIEAVRDTAAAMIALGDQPGLRPDAYRRVADRWREAGGSIVVPRYAGNDAPAHPVLFAAHVYPELLALDGDVGARSVIARDPSRVVEEPLEWPAPGDVDTVADLDALTGREPPPADTERRTAACQPSNTSEQP
jgi:molybdenum cofactor cytidylyltransferase